jgi:hypothetical protein
MTLSDQRRLQLCLVILSPARKAEPGLFLFRCFLPKGLRFEHDRKDWPRLEGNRRCNKSNPLGMHQCPNAQAYEDYEGKKKEKKPSELACQTVSCVFGHTCQAPRPHAISVRSTHGFSRALGRSTEPQSE